MDNIANMNAYSIILTVQFSFCAIKNVPLCAELLTCVLVYAFGGGSLILITWQKITSPRSHMKNNLFLQITAIFG